MQTTKLHQTFYKAEADELFPAGCKCSSTKGGGDCDWCQVYYNGTNVISAPNPHPSLRAAMEILSAGDGKPLDGYGNEDVKEVAAIIRKHYEGSPAELHTTAGVVLSLDRYNELIDCERKVKCQD